MASKIEKIREVVASDAPTLDPVNGTVETGADKPTEIIAEQLVDPESGQSGPVAPVKPKRKRTPKSANKAVDVPIVKPGVQPADSRGNNAVVPDADDDDKVDDRAAVDTERGPAKKLVGSGGERGIFKKVIYYREPTRYAPPAKSSLKRGSSSNARFDMHGEDDDDDEELSEDYDDEEEFEEYEDDDEFYNDGEFDDEDDEPIIADPHPVKPPKKRVKETANPKPVPVKSKKTVTLPAAPPVQKRAVNVQKQRYLFI